MSKTMPVSVHENDIVRAELVSMERAFQTFYAKKIDYVEMGWLTDEWIGSRLTDRVVMELIYRITYNSLHVDSKFEWSEMNIDDFLHESVPNFIPDGDRYQDCNPEDIKYSRAMDDLVHEIRIAIDTILSRTDLRWQWWEPMMTIRRRTSLEIEMFDYRSYLYMSTMLTRRNEDEEDEEAYASLSR